jgi:hypothetical protein
VVGAVSALTEAEVVTAVVCFESACETFSPQEVRAQRAIAADSRAGKILFSIGFLHYFIFSI